MYCLAMGLLHYRNGKNVENRTQNLKKRGTIAIYASATLSKRRLEDCEEYFGANVSSDDVTHGAIIGFVDVVGVITKKQVTSKTRKWFEGPYGYVLANPIKLKKPVLVRPKKGVIKFWKLKEGR